jgi:hypothetical protein
MFHILWEMGVQPKYFIQGPLNVRYVHKATYMVWLLILTEYSSIFEWYVIKWGSNNGHPKDTCSKESGYHVQNAIPILSSRRSRSSKEMGWPMWPPKERENPRIDNDWDNHTRLQNLQGKVGYHFNVRGDFGHDWSRPHCFQWQLITCWHLLSFSSWTEGIFVT